MSRLPAAALILLPSLAPSLAAQDWEVFATGNPEKVRAELAKLPRETGIHSKDEDGSTALTLAAQFNPDAEVTKLLLAAGADPLLVDGEGADALICAASGQTNLAVFDALLEAGAVLDSYDPAGWTPLMFAANLQKDSKVIAYLIKKGADVQLADDDGMTALMIAAAWNPNATVLAHLLKAGANPDYVDDHNGWTAFFFAAAQTTNPEILQLFLADGADPNAVDELEESVLMAAATFNPELAIHEFLIAQGADPKYSTGEGIGVLMNACTNPNPEVGLMYLGLGLDAKTSDQFGLTPLMVAAEMQADDLLVRALIEAGAKADQRDEEGWAALHFAWKPSVVTALLEAGADVNAQTDEGTTPLMMALSSEESIFELESVKLLLAAGASLEGSDYLDRTPLHLAVINGHLEATRILLEAGADPTATTMSGATLLELIGRFENDNDEAMTALVVAALKKAAQDD